eukprot:417704-Rhodomonas_salina.3
MVRDLKLFEDTFVAAEGQFASLLDKFPGTRAILQVVVAHDDDDDDDDDDDGEFMMIAVHSGATRRTKRKSDRLSVQTVPRTWCAVVDAGGACGSGVRAVSGCLQNLMQKETTSVERVPGTC